MDDHSAFDDTEVLNDSEPASIPDLDDDSVLDDLPAALKEPLLCFVSAETEQDKLDILRFSPGLQSAPVCAALIVMANEMLQEGIVSNARIYLFNALFILRWQRN